MIPRRWLLGVGIAALLCAERVIAQVSAEGMRVLARERSLAEQFLALLNEFGRKDVAQYARGVMLYAAAKAEFDGLITEVEHQLGQKLPPDQSPAFQTALNGAVEKRVAFTNFISDTVLPQGEETKKGIFDFIKVVPELVTALTNAGISIWQEFRSAGAQRQKEIRQELEALRWPAFKS